MRYYTLNRFGSKIHVFEYNPKNNPSQIVKSPTGYRQTLDKFKHNYFLDRGYKQVCVVNLGFFNMDDVKSIHIGILARDQGLLEGWPTTYGYTMWLDKNGKLNIERVTDRNEIAGKNVWGATLAYSLVLNGKKSIQSIGGFNLSSKTARTAFGQKQNGDIVILVADALTGNETADVMLELKCINAIMGDGGGSSSLIINGQWKKKTTRPLGTALIVFAKENVRQDNPSPTSTTNKPTLRLGDRNEYVKLLQESLNKLGINVGAVDGIFGNNTLNGVKTFQRLNGLIVDGIVGNQTWNKLDELINKINNSTLTPINSDKRKIKIAIDAGHGMNTPGKGVPQMKEHEFNATVAQYAKELAEHNGFEILLTQPLFSNTDIPLVDRTNLAIKEKVDLLVSIHADANDNPNVKGHWVFYWNPDNITDLKIKQLALESQKFAQIWDKYANQIMKNHCRGLVKSTAGQWNNFHMCRVPVTNKTHGFPSVLIEHAFMTNPDEIKLLLSDDFRRKCAEVIVRALCEYFNVPFKDKNVKPIETPTALPKQEQVQIDNLYRVIVDGKQLYALKDKENIAKNVVDELNKGVKEVLIQKV